MKKISAPHNEQGNAIVSVLVAIGVMSILLDSIASMMATQFQMHRDAEVINEARSLTSSLSVIFSTPTVCGSAIDKTAPLDVTAAKTANGHPIRLTLPNGATVSEGSTIPGWPLKISSLRFSDAKYAGIVSGGGASYIGKLRIAFERTDKGRSMKPRDVGYVTIMTTPTATGAEPITGCQSTAAVQELKDMCNSLGGSYDVVANKCNRPCGQELVVTRDGTRFLLPPGPNGSVNTVALWGSDDVSYLCVEGTWAKIADKISGGNTARHATGTATVIR